MNVGMNVGMNIGMNFGYELDKFQKDAIEAIDLNKNVLITAHTGSGKTTVAKYVTWKYISLGKRVFYITPIKALSNQIYHQFSDAFPTFGIGLKTGDIDINADGQLMIMTAEILRNYLFSLQKNEFMENVAAIVLDEVHWIQDESRGHVWVDIIKQTQTFMSGIQLCMLSATIDYSLFVKWLMTVSTKELCIISTATRIVPLTHYVIVPDSCFELQVVMTNTSEYIINRAGHNYVYAPNKLSSFVDWLSLQCMTPALFFCYNRSECVANIKNLCSVNVLTTIAEQHEITKFIDTIVAKYAHMDLESTAQLWSLREYLCKGFGYHHAGIVPMLKEIVEALFSRGLITVSYTHLTLPTSP
jgi:superfamily II RNA helicase